MAAHPGIATSNQAGASSGGARKTVAAGHASTPSVLVAQGAGRPGVVQTTVNPGGPMVPASAPGSMAISPSAPGAVAIQASTSTAVVASCYDPNNNIVECGQYPAGTCFDVNGNPTSCPIISGIPNSYLMIGGAVFLVLIAVLSRK